MRISRNSRANLEGREISGIDRAIKLLEQDDAVSQLAGLSVLRGNSLPAKARQRVHQLARSSQRDVASAAKALLGKTNSDSPQGRLTPVQLDVNDVTESASAGIGLKLLVSSHKQPNTEYPTPQADSLDFVIRGIAERQVNDCAFSESTIAKALSRRQVKYYENVIGFLRLDKFRFSDPESILTSERMQLQDFTHFVATIISRHDVLRELLLTQILHGGSAILPVEPMVEAWISKLNQKRLSAATLKRRTQTVEAWHRWITSHLRHLRTRDKRYSLELEGVDATALINHLKLVQAHSSQRSSSEGIQQGIRRSSSGHHTLNHQKNFVLIRRLGRIFETDGPTLKEIGDEWGVTRERVRQLEAKLRTSIQAELDSHGSEIHNALAAAERLKKPINLQDWVFKTIIKLKDHERKLPTFAVTRNAVQPTKQPDEMNLLAYGDSGTTTAHYAPGARSVSATTILTITAVLRTALEARGYQATKQSEYLYARESTKLEHLQHVSRKVQNPMARPARQRRISDIKKELEQSPMRVGELAARLGEQNPRSLAEFMRRQKNFWSNRGVWHLADIDRHKPKYSNVYEAVVATIREHGPLHMAQLKTFLADSYPVSESRISQALDDSRVGHSPDGRIALVDAGGVRAPEPEPAAPKRLRILKNSALLTLSVTKEQMRGSGFLVPRWIGWRLQLHATPDSITLRSSHGESLKLTRRGGQIYASSILNLLVSRNITTDCSIELRFDLQGLEFELIHLCVHH